jgi:hypothetical protein
MLSTHFRTELVFERIDVRPQRCYPVGVERLLDELLFEVRSDRVREVAELVSREMEAAMPMDVTTPVKISFGPSWGQLQPLRR